MKKAPLLKTLWTFLSKRRKLQFFLILLFMVTAAFLEVISLGAVIPFLAVLTNPEKILKYDIIELLFQYVGIEERNETLLFVTCLFIFVVMITAVVRVVLLYASTKFSFSVAADISYEVYKRTLYQRYEVHVSRNSSEVINGIIRKSSVVSYGVITPVMTILMSAVMIFFISIALLFIDALLALSTLFGFIIAYSIIIYVYKSQISKNGKINASASTRVLKLLQEGLGGIREVLIDNNQDFYCELYRSTDIPLRKASANNVFLAGSPRFLMEAIGLALIASIALIMQYQSGDNSVLPTLGVLALAAQRLLPAAQHAYAAYVTLLGSFPELKDIILLLEQEMPKKFNDQGQTSNFKHSLKIENVSFRHVTSSKLILDQVTLEIKKGSRIGFVGASGSGKSTLIDVIMMLLSPTSGNMYLDSVLLTEENKRNWQRNISHVPQEIFLVDATIAENIAFGIEYELIDRNRVKQVAKIAQLSEVIDVLPEGYQTKVGERGLMLSGGQKQRIGIARALYKEPNVLVLDEATSALDAQTEARVMEEIANLQRDMTILVIAHRISTLKDCNQIIELDGNGSFSIKSYDDLKS